MQNELARAAVDNLFEDLRDRRFLKWLFDERGEECLIDTFKDGEELRGLDLDVQEEIKAAWAEIIGQAIAKERERNRWRPIDEAPKDGTEILLYVKDCIVILGRWISPAEFILDGDTAEKFTEDEWHEPDWFGADFVSGFRISNDGPPVAWHPLPSPPAPLPSSQEKEADE